MWACIIHQALHLRLYVYVCSLMQAMHVILDAWIFGNFFFSTFFLLLFKFFVFFFFFFVFLGSFASRIFPYTRIRKRRSHNVMCYLFTFVCVASLFVCHRVLVELLATYTAAHQQLARIAVYFLDNSMPRWLAMYATFIYPALLPCLYNAHDFSYLLAARIPALLLSAC